VLAITSDVCVVCQHIYKPNTITRNTCRPHRYRLHPHRHGQVMEGEELEDVVNQLVVGNELANLAALLDVNEGEFEDLDDDDLGSLLATRAAFVRTLAPPSRPFAMEMRKIACAVLVAAATITTALAAEAPAPGPASAASVAATPAVGAAIGASVLSFFAFYLQ
ncbi:hypothetical protein GW17_00008953, partial [Ensete ventricosum]